MEKQIVYRIEALVSYPVDTTSELGDLLETIRSVGAVKIKSVKLMSAEKADQIVTKYAQG